MNTEVITIPEKSTYEETARILHENGISGAPVVDRKGRMIGFISEKDLLRVLYPYYRSYYKRPADYTDAEKREQKVKEIRKNTIIRFMKPKVHCIDVETPIMRIGAIMLARNVTKLPVIEKDSLVGIVSRGDIYRKILKDHLELA